jgi:DNA-binding transcriptional regulator YiaG
MHQKDVAKQIEVDTTSVHNWEGNLSKPEIRYMPAIIRFVGYSPLPEAKSWADRLVQGRTALGFSQKEAARRLDADQGTLARWERGEREPTGRFVESAERFLAEAEHALAPAVARTA